MKSKNETKRGRPIGAIGAAAGVLLAGLSVLALVGGTGVGQGMGGMSGDNEGVGTLPMFPARSVVADVFDDERPGFYLQGPAWTVYRAVQWLDCKYTVEWLPDRTGGPTHVRLRFQGEVHLSLVSEFFLQPGINAGIALGKSYGDAFGGIVFGDRVVRRAVLAPESQLPAPLATMLELGLLDEGLLLVTANRLGERNVIGVTELSYGVVEIHQFELTY